MLGQYPFFDSFCPAVFIVGTFFFLVGLINNLSVWKRGIGRSLPCAIKEGIRIIFSIKVIRVISAIIDCFIHRRLFKESILRGIAMAGIIISYIGVILVNHIKAMGMPGLRDNLSHFGLFFYAPFSDFYFMRTITEEAFTKRDALYALLNDGFGFLILVVGEGILIWRRFIKRAYVFKMKWSDIFATLLLGGWFGLRFLAEAITILAFSLPDTIAKYWFGGYILSKAISFFGLNWQDFYLMSWCLSGVFLGTLVGSIPWNRKLWHIFSAPICMVLNSLAEERHIYSRKENGMSFTKRQLLEIDSCIKCGICADHCVVYSITKDEHSVIGGIVSHYEKAQKERHGFFSSLIDREPETKEHQELISSYAYLCTLCGRCKTVCPIKINTRSLRISMREDRIKSLVYPKGIDLALDSAKKEFNVLNYPNSDRIMWAEFLDFPLEKKEKGEILYFVGCMTSFSPAISNIAEANARLLHLMKEDFVVLGEREACCGFPLIVAGLSQEWQWLRDKNIETITSLGVKRIVFNCASCYHTFKHEYQAFLPNVLFLHNTEYLDYLVSHKKIEFSSLKKRITYHDPCDLGRGCGIFEEPRRVIRAIPEVEYLE
ncbi:MAG: (Fe-S)-binding protein, partial [bacterium]